MICFRLTPLWKIKETEQWLNDLAANGQVLRAVYGPFYLFSQSKEKKPSVHYGLDFYEKGQEHAYAPWYLKFNGLTVHTVCSYYWYININSQEPESATWRNGAPTETGSQGMHCGTIWRSPCSVLWSSPSSATTKG